MLGFHVKFVQTDRRMDRQTDNSKTICPLIFRYGGIKMPLKTLWEKKKMLVTNIFFFPTMFSTLPKNKS